MTMVHVDASNHVFVERVKTQSALSVLVTPNDIELRPRQTIRANAMIVSRGRAAGGAGDSLIAVVVNLEGAAALQTRPLAGPQQSALATKIAHSAYADVKRLTDRPSRHTLPAKLERSILPVVHVTDCTAQEQAV